MDQKAKSASPQTLASPETTETTHTPHHPTHATPAHPQVAGNGQLRPLMKLGLMAAPDPADVAMVTLTSQWYNAVVAGLGLDQNTFQLVQGVVPLGAQSQALWQILDAIPPLSVTSYFNPSQANLFSSNYGAVLKNLIPQNSGQFIKDMGDSYGDWDAYLHSTPPPTIPADGMLGLFTSWANLNISDPGQAATCIADYQALSTGTVLTARQMWGAANPKPGAILAYNSTIAALNRQLASSTQKHFTFDSRSQSSDVSHSWAQVNSSGFFDFFSLGGGGSYDNLTQKMTSAGVSIDATFQRVVTFTAGPLAQVSTDPDLKNYLPWYSSAAMNLAYHTQDNTVWSPGVTPTWDTTFGTSGSTLRLNSGLLVVDGLTIVTTSQSAFSSTEQAQFQAAASGGFFPFFEASGSGGWSHVTKFDASGNLTVTSTSPLGNPVVLGCLVTPIATAMGG